jgi:hypothetical protein
VGEYGVVNESRFNAKGLARESWSQLEKIGVMYDQNSDQVIEKMMFNQIF